MLPRKLRSSFQIFSKASIEGLNNLKSTVSKAMDDDKESVNRFFDMCDTIIDAIKLTMSDGEVTFEEKKYCIDRMQEIAKMASEKYSEDKKFKMVFGCKLRLNYSYRCCSNRCSSWRIR